MTYAQTLKVAANVLVLSECTTSAIQQTFVGQVAGGGFIVAPAEME
jgi:hypothetical protein